MTLIATLPGTRYLNDISYYEHTSVENAPFESPGDYMIPHWK